MLFLNLDVKTIKKPIIKKNAKTDNLFSNILTLQICYIFYTLIKFILNIDF